MKDFFFVKIALFIAFYTSITFGFTSLDFVLPDLEIKIGRDCFRYSGNFCLLRFYSEAMVSMRPSPNTSDIRVMEKIARDTHKMINWYSFNSYQGCCSYQILTYLKFGQNFGYSPEHYLSKLTDFSSVGKSLNYIVWIFLSSSILFGGNGFNETQP
ncbi:uncharacterized protein LOC142349476 isoform X2 [Convolutriloba macropyga]|uniref:uncharacterized protein LOC142349476 isoform X2 n=1 Tax=Convolutriloba macropyga TaxID=536237 RepID=UPI003F5249DE